MDVINTLPMKSDELTRRDPILGQVLQYTRNGWPVKTSKELTPFRHRINSDLGMFIMGTSYCYTK